jgi:uncharacterized protein YbjQ (UPF0145 family)
MDFFKKIFNGYQDQKRRDAENERLQQIAVKALESGEIFPRAKERIDREMALGKKFFSSDLSVREYLLCREAGLETVGQVMGSCFYNISLFGLVGRSFGLTQSEYNHDKYMSNSGSLQKQSGELIAITEAQLKARQTAVDRMLLEAKAMGAHGVIGVRVKSSHFNWATRMTEFTAMGTAVRLPNYTANRVFTSDLQGQEFWQLYNAGYLPHELAFGVCSYYIKCDPATRQIIDPTLVDVLKGRSRNNQEIGLFTQGFYDARALAMERLESNAMATHSDGLVSMHIDYSIQTVEYTSANKTFHDPVIHFIAKGTSISKIPDHVKPIAKPKLCLSLSGGTWTDFDFGDFPSYAGSNFGGDDFDDDD